MVKIIFFLSNKMHSLITNLHQEIEICQGFTKNDVELSDSKYENDLQQILKCKVNLVKRATYWSGKHRISFHSREF